MAPTLTDVFPSLYACTKLQDGQTISDIKFYPFSTEDNDQIFAAIGEHDIFVLRPVKDEEQPFEVLRWFKDFNRDHSYNTLCWTKDPLTHKPLLCVSGASPKIIQIIDIESGSVKHTLNGHGRGVNDLAISPLSTNLLVSASDDYTIRLWNLDPRYATQPCVAIFAGEGHRQPILAAHFHLNGKWLLSSGLDTAVCLWPVPSLADLDRFASAEDGTPPHPKPQTVYYPHFYSTEVHADYIDNVVFYGDLILSRCSKDQSEADKGNSILLWKIDGFDSNANPPDHPPVPRPGQCTRSSFPHAKGSRGFQRLLTFDMPNTDRFYLRFGLLHQPNMRPILAMGNQISEYMFWDLQKLEQGWAPGEARHAAGSKSGKKVGAKREPKIMGIGQGSFPTERKYDLDDPMRALKPHRVIPVETTLYKQHFGAVQIAWSPDGCWMVGVGDYGVLCFFWRDKSVINAVV